MKRDGAARRNSGLCWWKIALFVGCFVVVFGACQWVLKVKHMQGQSLRVHFATYESLPPDTVDIVFFGSSRFDHAISPNVMWNEAGIASYNMSASAHLYSFAEQNLLTALELNTPPKYAVFVPQLLYSTDKYNEESLAVYDKLVRSLPTLAQRVRAMQSFCREVDRQQADIDKKLLLLPLLAYHNRWSSLSKADFLPYCAFDAQDPPYMMGQAICLESKDISEEAQSPEMNDMDNLNPWAMEAWRQIFELCHAKGIAPVVVRPPHFSRCVTPRQAELAGAFYEECGVLVYDYTTPDAMARLNLLHYLS